MLKYISPSLAAEGRGSTFLQVGREALEAMEVPLPTIEEQRGIAAILDKADAIRRKRRQALALTDELLRSTFLDVFGDPDGQGWPMVTVAELVAPEPNSVRTGPFGSQLLHSEFVDSGVSVLGIDNAVANEFQWRERRFISEQKYSELRRYTVRPGDVLITIMGTCGRCAIVPDDIPTAINTKHLCCITLDGGKCLPSFLHSYFLWHPVARSYLARSTKGAIMDGLNMGIIKKLPVPTVPIALQESFERLRGSLLMVKAAQAQQQQAADALFQSLTHQAFTGQL